MELLAKVLLTLLLAHGVYLGVTKDGQSKPNPNYSAKEMLFGVLVIFSLLVLGGFYS